jgi:hypothetical protein
MSARDELAGIYMYTLNMGHGMVSRPEQGNRAADAILAAGYRKPRIIGYAVVDRDGHMIGKQFKDVDAAQAFADEWTADCKTSGIDWDYRVAAITEVTE